MNEEKRLYKLKRYNKKRFYIIAFIWIVVISVLTIVTHRKMTQDLKDKLGKEAMITARDVATFLELSQEDVDRLLSQDFNEVLSGNINIRFEIKARLLMKYSDIKYIYLETLLPDNKVKYTVQKEEVDKYNKPEGTPLNVVYLLDAVVSDQVREEDTGGKGYTDKDRYTAADEYFLEAYNNKEQTYYINKDEWGKYITGYAPVHSKTGEYIGLIGVDMYMDRYFLLLRNNSKVILSFVIANSIIALLVLHLIIYIRRADKQLQEKTILSCTDHLTSCLNRRHFDELLEKEWHIGLKNQTPIGIIFVDLDYFKEFNDNYGHVEGDTIISKIATVLIDIVEAYDGVVGRYGGDEFIIMLPNSNDEQAHNIASLIKNKIALLKIRHEYSPITNYQTVSIGVAILIPKEDVSTSTLIDYADHALYQSKRNGRDSIYLWNDKLILQ